VEPGERAELEALRSFGGLLEESGLGGKLDVAGGVALTVAALPDVLVINRALGMGVDQPATAEDVAAVDEFFRKAGTRYQIAVSPEAGGFAELLADSGFAREYPWAVFRRSVGPYEASTQLRVAKIDASGADDFATVVLGAYGMPEAARDAVAVVVGAPGWHSFVACDGDEPAGAASVFVHERGAWFGVAGTLPEHRRKGAQGALLSARIRKAAELGVEVLATETGTLEDGRPSNSYRNLTRVGFEEIYVRPNYAPRS
jgi:GNAT superfamily N-acetyltransferase